MHLLSGVSSAVKIRSCASTGFLSILLLPYVPVTSVRFARSLPEMRADLAGPSCYPHLNRMRVAKYNMYRFLVASLGARRLFSMPRQYNHVYFYPRVSYTHEIFFGSSWEPLYSSLCNEFEKWIIRRKCTVNVTLSGDHVSSIKSAVTITSYALQVFLFFFPGRKLVTVTYKTSIEINLMHVLVQNAERMLQFRSRYVKKNV